MYSPVKEQVNDIHEHSYIPLDHSVDDSPLHDIIPDTSDAEPEAPLLAHFADSLASIYKQCIKGQKQAVKAMQHHIFDGISVIFWKKLKKVLNASLR